MTCTRRNAAMNSELITIEFNHCSMCGRFHGIPGVLRALREVGLDV
jgi:hypothetical protein